MAIFMRKPLRGFKWRLTRSDLCLSKGGGKSPLSLRKGGAVIQNITPQFFCNEKNNECKIKQIHHSERMPCVCLPRLFGETPNKGPSLPSPPCPRQALPVSQAAWREVSGQGAGPFFEANQLTWCLKLLSPWPHWQFSLFSKPALVLNELIFIRS